MKKSVFSYVASVLVFILVFLSVYELFASVSNQLYGVVDHSTSNMIGIVQWMVLLLLVVPLDLALCIRAAAKTAGKSACQRTSESLKNNVEHVK